MYVTLPVFSYLRIGSKRSNFRHHSFAFRDASCSRHADSASPDSSVESRRFTNNQDVLWILNHLSRHGRLLHLKLGFSGRRTVRMSPRDGDFLQALKGVKTDKLTIGDPKFEPSSPYSVSLFQSPFSQSFPARAGLFGQF